MTNHSTPGENGHDAHGVVSTLDTSQHAVAVVTEPSTDTERPTYLVGFDNGFAEIRPGNNRATHIGRDAVHHRLEALPDTATVSIMTDRQLDAETEREISQQLAQLRTRTDTTEYGRTC